MSADTKIEWAHHTFNPWWGCARVSPGCVHCYADTLASRWGHELWRRHGPRKPMSAQYWRQPLGWNRKAADTEGPVRVFCASMADVFEPHPEPEVRAMQDQERARLWELIGKTPNLIWMLLTKRPQSVAEMAPWGEDWPINVWLGTSVEDQRRADERIPELLMVPATVRFLSCEPLLGPVNLTRVAYAGGGGTHLDVVNGRHGIPDVWAGPSQKLSWVISGGESGRKARPMHPAWVRSLRDQCASAGVAYHFKQRGEWTWDQRGGSDYPEPHAYVRDTDGRVADEDTALIESGHWQGIWRVGKGTAGRDLDGRTWDEFPVGSA